MVSVLLVFNVAFGAVELICLVWALLAHAYIKSCVLSFAAALFLKFLKPNVIRR